jgi:hypothetical protein
MPVKPRVHDRRSTDLPFNARVIPEIVEDPLDPGSLISVQRSIRSDPFALMHSRGHIDAPQYTSGRLWQFYRERSEVGNIRAIDPTREAVDGGRFKPPDISKMSAALLQLKLVDRALQPYEASVVCDVLERNMSIREIATARSITSGRQIGSLMITFRGGLDVIGEVLGVTTRA